MVMYSKRDTGYKVGMLVFCLGVAAFVTGFTTNYWVRFQFRVPVPSLPPVGYGLQPGQTSYGMEGHTGLWRYCLENDLWGGGSPVCTKVTTHDLYPPDWLLGVKIVLITSMGIMGLALLFFFFTNCVVQKAAFTRLLEVATGISGILGLIGAGIFLWKNFADDDIKQNLQENYDFELSLSWSFYLVAGSCVIILLATLLVAIFNRPIPPKQPPYANFGYPQGFEGPTAPPFEGPATPPTVGRNYAPTGNNAYVMTAAMTGGAGAATPKLYPSLQDVNEEKEE